MDNIKVELKSYFGNKFVITAEQYEEDPNLVKVEFEGSGIVVEKGQMIKMLDLFNKL
jgi:hypothetical protein